ncbi:MAG: oligosaccharide flippase family protein, partial [Planctomycetota bacterium]
MLAAPLLSRLYSPRDFGLMAIFTALTAIGGTLATLRYDHAIPLPKDERSAVALARLTGRLRLGFTGCLLLAASLWGDWLDRLLFNASDAPYSLLLAASVAAISGYQLHNAWMVRKGRFSDLSRMRVYYVSACLAAQLTLPFLWPGGPPGLLLGSVFGYAVASAAMRMKGSGNPPYTVEKDRFSVWRTAAVYRIYPLCDVWSCLLLTMSNHGLTMAFAWLYGPAVAGGLALAQRAVGTPVAMLGASVSRVYYREAALRLDQPDQLRKLFNSTLRQTLMVATPPLGIAALTAPLAFGKIFGAQWQTAGVYCTILCPLVLLRLVCHVLGSTLDVVDRQGLRMVRELTATLLVAAGLLVASRLQWTAVGAAAASSALG